MYREESEKNKKVLEEMKETIKKSMKSIKDLETGLNEEKSSSNKLTEKLKER